MTHANTFTLEDGWAAVRRMLETIAARFGPFETAPLARDVYEEVLQWLRAGEHLARLMLYIIAHALAPLVRVARTCGKRSQRARGAAFRFAVRVAHRSRRVRRARHPGLYLWRRPRAPHSDDTDGWPVGVFEEARQPPQPAPPPAALVLAMPAAPLAARLAALARVLADPLAVARRIGAWTRDTAATQRLLAPRRIFTRTPCDSALLHIHDRAFALPVRDSS